MGREPRYWRDKPRHDWASHGADGFRTLALDWKEIDPELTKEQIEANRKAEADKVSADVIKPRTFSQIIEEYEREQEEHV